MSAKSHENLKSIRFEGELLPNWAQLLDLAARLCPVSEEVRRWFSRLTHSAGVDDSQTVVEQCGLLKKNMEEHRHALFTELQRDHHDAQSAQILAAWTYALDTMIEAARTKETCSWVVEGADDTETNDPGDGNITLRRV